MAYNWLMMTSSAEVWIQLPTKPTKQKHYEYLATTFCEKTLPRNNLKDWKQQRLRDSRLAQCLGCKRFYFIFFAQRGCMICNGRLFVYLAQGRKGLLIDFLDEYIFAYVQRVLTSAEVFYFSSENSIMIASGEVNTILFITVRAFQ